VVLRLLKATQSATGLPASEPGLRGARRRSLRPRWTRAPREPPGQRPSGARAALGIDSHPAAAGPHSSTVGFATGACPASAMCRITSAMISVASTVKGLENLARSPFVPGGADDPQYDRQRVADDSEGQDRSCGLKPPLDGDLPFAYALAEAIIYIPADHRGRSLPARPSCTTIAAAERRSGRPPASP